MTVKETSKFFSDFAMTNFDYVQNFSDVDKFMRLREVGTDLDLDQVVPTLILDHNARLPDDIAMQAFPNSWVLRAALLLRMPGTSE